ncbi:hypothetical protein [Gracilimonas sp. BCB1]|uniref:hypothetical protein n=1 Tax=Gracilimonas sp. BCB1 TaxID=3152362 RepID=UPI0032D94BF3
MVNSRNSFYGLLLAMVFLSGCIGMLGDEPLPELEIVTIEKAYNGYNTDAPIEMVIKNQGDYEEIWGRIFKSRQPFPQPPQIDFERQTLIMIMLDLKYSGGYEITDLEAVRGSDYISIRYREEHPGKYCGVTEVLTKPFHLFTISEKGWPVRFNKMETVYRDCKN